ncbi:MAG: ECF transporter S component, partial [Firmicutes bacterium]|nr:ECF transporter S component [Bacillota bacterium]
MQATSKRMSTETMVLGGLLTALVVVLQFMGTFIHLGPFSISLVLIPIVIGAAACGVGVSTWLGLVFGMVVLLNGDAAAFLAVDALGALFTVLGKGMACGLAAGLTYRALAGVKPQLAVLAAAIVCPVANTGVFLLGCKLFFMDIVAAMAQSFGFTGSL